VRAALIAALHASDAGTREMAAVLLARSPESDARQALAGALEDDAPSVRAAAAVAILGDSAGQGIGLEPERAESCLGSLATGDVAARAASLEAFRRLRRPLTDARLAACVADPSPEVRAAAMSALENTLTPAAADALVAGLSDPAARVRAAAATTLAARSEADPRVVDLLGTTDATTEAAAIAALAGHGEHARDRILAWADDEVTHALALSGARVDLRSGGPADTPDFAFLCSVLDHRVVHARSMALGAMAALGAPAAGGVIRRSLGSTDPDVRAQAIEALDSIGDRGLGRSIARLIEDAPSAQLLDASTVLMRLRDDDDPWIRALARRVLPSGGDVTETDHVTSDIETMLQLRRVPLFERLSPEDLQRIASVASERWFEEDAPLVREGEAGDELFVILAGRVRVVHTADAGAERTVRTYGEGDHIGELAVLRERPRIATVIADGGGVRTLVIGGEGLRAILRERPDAAMAMLATLAERISTQP
jgi:HEAT repeat protein